MTTLLRFGLAAVGLALAMPSSAAVILPDLGASEYYFEWTGGLGPIDEIYDPATGAPTGESVWQLTLSSAAQVIFSVRDAFIAGDQFGAVLDGLASGWTSTDTSGDYFTGSYAALLGPGTHTFSLDLTSLASGFDDGGAYASFVVSNTPAAVPLPASLPLLGGALLVAGLAAARARRRG